MNGNPHEQHERRRPIPEPERERELAESTGTPWPTTRKKPSSRAARSIWSATPSGSLAASDRYLPSLYLCGDACKALL